MSIPTSPSWAQVSGFIDSIPAVAWVFWVSSIVIAFIMMMIIASPEHEGGEWHWENPKYHDDIKFCCRWMLAAIFLGWMMPVLLFWKAFKHMWLKSELPRPRVPEIFRSGVVDQDAGSLSFPKRER